MYKEEEYWFAGLYVGVIFIGLITISFLSFIFYNLNQSHEKMEQFILQEIEKTRAETIGEVVNEIGKNIKIVGLDIKDGEKLWARIDTRDGKIKGEIMLLKGDNIIKFNH